MSSRTGELNEKWAKLLIKELIHQGVRYFCIAPGSRSTSLTVAASEHPLANTFVHFDERALCFHALGYAKATGIPAAVIVTSGTAVGNLMPAVMEAHNDHVPMILLTSDRPPELRQTGANQTADQVKMFQNFVRWQEDFPCPDPHISPAFIGSTIATALAHALSAPAGPVQLNCMFREPFFENETENTHPSYERSIKGSQTQITLGEKHLAETQIEKLCDELSEHEKGVIVVGALPPNTSLEPLFTLSRLLQWPLFPDILSPLRSHVQAEGMVPTYDLILKSMSLNEDLTPDAILQFGNRFVSKKLLEWIRLKKPKCHTLVADHEWRMDPLHSLTHRVVADPWQVMEGLSKHLPGRAPAPWLQCWKEMNRITQKTLTHFFQEKKDLTEPALFHHLSRWIGEDRSLFIGNSLPIREADALFAPKQNCGPVFGNRGVSGIDGNIATATGIAKGLRKPLLAIMGDLTFLHDLTSLAQLKNSPVPITLLVINNDGGGIFSFLPIAKRKAVFEQFFVTPHGLNLEHAAPLFGLKYEKVTTLDEMETALQSGTTQSKILEMCTDRDETLALHKEIIAHVKEILTTSSSSLEAFT
ncbi:MAG: 2-succinyl-5-enolpyruvyl-6-hydroxy-3-cyclohexene-1-carboxylic-acid synthase [Simkania sp.]|nr:2-succinyl-5-enolpyruvyl-6-hydroxy-3-cyclohexene-1-carboxylic-acid synthase [Simkania sp.]